jgi:hypothetical protein
VSDNHDDSVDYWEYDDEQERLEHIAMITCPYYWVGTLPSDIATCRSGCWEEPACHTNGPFGLLPDWPKERCIAAAVRRVINERPRA